MAVNQIDGISVGEYGEDITLTVTNEDGGALDLSAYTGTNEVVLLSPDQLKSITRTTSWATDGTDGKVTFAFQSGDVDREGDWSGQVKFTATGIVAKTNIFTMTVEKAIA